MKSAYELAMERLQKQSPSRVLSDAQKRQISETESVFAARIAELELGLQEKLPSLGEDEAAAAREETARLIRKLKDDCEAAKAKIRAG